ncbi:J domain-containing protein [Acanthopleuribacter pedis]|uniref:J domain-containing protein n=1 Tax=Acanthopleuribacter pedis TaxID=442870 RepID=A0A8J7QDZ7_9BACT|nr:J domain-containing protein [Acanthopleuribacter pedis]MBO1322419.1 J domain-containing protein [Acanthopleuribacter pedis]
MEQQPPWHLLPADPRGFFGLTRDMTRRDLKRRYVALLKRFKPEHHPHEFMTLRAAYEKLCAELDQIAAEASLVEQVLPPEPKPAPMPRGTPLQSMHNVEPEMCYRHLTDQRKKEPEHYVLLAFLSDVIDHGEPHAFLRWVLFGLNQFPDDPALNRLFDEVLLGVEPHGYDTVLRILADTCEPRLFYQLALAPFATLLTVLPFAQWKTLLFDCESRLRAERLPFRLPFMVELARRGFWRADASWLHQFFEYFDHQLDAVDDELEMDLDLLEIAWAYRLEWSEKTETTPLALLLHQQMQACFAADTPAVQSALERLCLTLKEHALLLTEEPDDGGWVNFEHLLNRLLERYAPYYREEDGVPARVADYLVRHFLVELEVSGEKQFIIWLWRYAVLATWGGLLFLAIALPLWFSFYVLAALPSAAKGLLFFVGLYASRFLFEWLPISDYYRRFQIWFGERMYRTHWRIETLQFLSRSGLSFDHFVALLKEMPKEQNVPRWYLTLLEEDRVLALFARAQCLTGDWWRWRSGYLS